MIEIIEVNRENVDDKGFFCMRSKPGSEGYKKKLSWLKERFQEGLRLKILEEDGRPKGFIEYMPSELNWRGVSGVNYMVVHCLWIVGKSKGKGYGAALLKACLDDAKSQQKSGVAMVTSSQTWLAEKSFFMKHGFQEIDTAPPCFELIANRFDHQPVPQFNHGWERRAENQARGITIIKADQCPYFEDAVNVIMEVAAERGLAAKLIHMENCQDAQHAPSAFGVFNVLLNGKLITYHPMTKREFTKLLDKIQ